MTRKKKPRQYMTQDDVTAVMRKDVNPYNRVPEGWREITEADFAQSLFFTYEPERTEYRQFHPSPVKDESGSPLVAARLYHFHDGTGVGLMNDFWGGRIRYFKFGCEHAYTELSVKECCKRGIRHEGKCWQVYECAKCKHIEAHDSSD